MGEAEAGEILPERDIDMSAAYDMLHKSKASVEDIVSQMLSIKKDSKPKSDFREFLTQIFLNFVTLRQVSLCTCLLLSKAQRGQLFLKNFFQEFSGILGYQLLILTV